MAVQYVRTTENNDENEKHYTMTNTSCIFKQLYLFDSTVF